METLTCPDCGTDRVVEQVERSAACFCGKCDYPLFWLPTVQLSGSIGETGEAALRRLPGAGGRQQLVDVACAGCGELNPLNSRACLRCGASLVPEPPPVVLTPAAPAPIRVLTLPPPPPTPASRFQWWWWLALSFGLALVTILILLLVN